MKLINVDIAVNLTDGMFRGIYRQATAAVHASDLHLVVGQRARQFGVERAIITCTHLQEIPQSLQLIINNNNGHVDESIKLFTTVGVHPTRCGEFESAEHHSTSNLSINERADAYYKKLEEYIQQDQQQDHKSKKIVAIGECGLDWDRVEFCSKALQLKYFIKQLNLSKKYNLVSRTEREGGREGGILLGPIVCDRRRDPFLHLCLLLLLLLSFSRYLAPLPSQSRLWYSRL